MTDLSKSPFRMVNYITLEKGEGRKHDTYIVAEQVYNPADGTFSMLYFGFDKYEKSRNPDQGTSDLLHDTDPPRILLPQTLYNDRSLFNPGSYE